MREIALWTREGFQLMMKHRVNPSMWVSGVAAA